MSPLTRKRMYRPGPVVCIESPALHRCARSVCLRQGWLLLANRLSFPRSGRSQLAVTAMDTQFQVPRHLLTTYRLSVVPAYSLLTFTTNCSSNIPNCSGYYLRHQTGCLCYYGRPKWLPGPKLDENIKQELVEFLPVVFF